jgi:4-hydroxybenzoate polyprenyltransferase
MRIPGVGSLALPPVIGAITTYSMSLTDLIPLFIIGILFTIFGFVLNDYIDVDVDRLSKDLVRRPLVKGTIATKHVFLILISCFLMAWVIIFYFFYQPIITFYLGILCMGLALFLVIIYDLFGKKVLGSDFIFALSETFFFLFGALIVVGEKSISIFTWIGSILLFNQMLYENAITGGLKDADHDYLYKVRNIASAFGVKVKKDKKIFIPLPFKAFGITIHIISAPLVFIPFVFYEIPYEPWQIISLIVLIILALYLNVLFLSLKQFDRTKLRRIIVVHLFIRYSIVPIMLVSILGIFSMVLLIFFPLVWYLFISKLMHEKILEPEM